MMINGPAQKLYEICQQLSSHVKLSWLENAYSCPLWVVLRFWPVKVRQTGMVFGVRSEFISRCT